jgi:uncharacterized protein YecT (DUF1311 family)
MAATAKEKLEDEAAKLNSPEYEACTDVKYIMSEMADCNNAEIEKQDRVLNTTYKSVMSRLSPGEQQALREKERAWIKHRDSYCEKGAADAMGADRAMVVSSCVLTQEEVRILYLRKLAH